MHSRFRHRGDRRNSDEPGAKIRVEFGFKIGSVKAERVDDLIEPDSHSAIGCQSGQNKGRAAKVRLEFFKFGETGQTHDRSQRSSMLLNHDVVALAGPSNQIGDAEA